MIPSKNAGLLHDAMEKLFESKEDADMTFVINGKDLTAHKLVVSLRSPVLKEAIHELSANRRYEINDPIFTFDAFENFLQFLYTDNCDINKTNVEKIIYLGNMYDVKSLLEKCVTKISTWFTKDNILKYAELGLVYENSCTLLHRCFEALPSFELLSLSYICDNDGETHLISPNLVLKLVEDCPRSKVWSEDLFFKKIYDWAQLKVAEQRVIHNHEIDLQTIMAPFIPHFTFDRISPLTLATHVYPSGCLSHEKFAEVICKAVISKSKSF